MKKSTSLDIIKSIRKPVAPSVKIFKVKTKYSRKQKHVSYPIAKARGLIRKDI